MPRHMLEYTCESCSMKFLREPSKIKNKKHLFCSKECRQKHCGSKVIVECSYCESKFKRFLSAVQKKNYCSQICQKAKRDSKVLDMVGNKYGNLTVLDVLPNKGRARYLACLCDCGNLCEIIPTSLTSKNSTTCGKCTGLNVIERFEFYTEKSESGCWIWKGPKCPKGYGQLRVDGKMIGSHRLSWELHNGPIPDGLYICHICDVRACVSPSCMFLGTHQENQIDMAKKGRGANVTWTNDQVLKMRDMFKNGSTRKDIIDLFGVDYTYLCSVLSGKTRIYI